MSSFSETSGAVRRRSTKGTESRQQRSMLALVVMGVLIVWTFFYNILAKDMAPHTAFFKIIDTLSDDFFLGAVMTVGVGLGILAVFTLTKLSTQIISNVYSFRVLEDLIVATLSKGDVKGFIAGLLRFEDLPEPDTIYPDRPVFILVGFSIIFAMSWGFVVLFSEALFFVSWSAGVDLPITETNMLYLPTLALAIPFSARIMAFARYPYAQDFADYMPAAFFVVGMVAFLGFIHQSDDQQFYLMRVYGNPDFRVNFLSNGLFLAFVPVFAEAIFWLLHVTHLNKQEHAAAQEDDIDA